MILGFAGHGRGSNTVQMSAGNGGTLIAQLLEHLKLQDVQLLLENRGLPSIGGKEQLTERLQAALSEEICEFEWETGDVPACHAGPG